MHLLVYLLKQLDMWYSFTGVASKQLLCRTAPACNTRPIPSPELILHPYK
ncbi:hypothetical protein F2Q69_00011403 [Brassica cretica]|uniref:Uncharacterized protein n=1 Tax=Brassica cretica TaxID=69181 RepID=A0A8S9QFH5_BRACR|nr:hypothetical protein F2Q69_00011403 [Brassica cretica]